ncbi:uncharacterized protein LOC133837986 [Drosophila sulfurigaster albostrigata]|uniref:uncharacterized protein LOC133837986 n=1 Tax=Drosophila sulfurigaster albostrigata TaxID=89887 RepID=UPI002D2197EB|nr:uncharacterized protein LOC133837986 [Drosophila sulfurigaster albostrigata]
MRTNAIVSCLVLLFHNVCCTENTWVEPHDWTKLSPESFNHPTNTEDACLCQAPTEPKSIASVEDQLALIYFKKFVNSLFSRNKLQHSKSAQLFKRSLLFTLLPSQIEELEAAQDVRDIDIVLSQIMDKAKDLSLYTAEGDYGYSHQGMGVKALITDMYKDFVQLLRISEVKFLLAVLLSIAAGWLVRKRYRIPIFVIVIGGVFLYGYFHTYLECNRKMEVDAMLEVIDSHQEIDQSSWFSRLFGFISRETPEQIQKKRLIKSTKLIMPFCRPDHVFVIYTSDIFIKQIEMLLEKTTDTMTKLTNGLGFPYNLIAPIALVCMISYMLKLTFKYIISPKVWIQFMHRNPPPPVQATQQASLAGGSANDSLSGENLKMLLNVMNRAQLTSSESQAQLAVSGVEEVLEQLEAPPPSTSPTKKVKPSSKDTSSEELNASSSFADIAQEAGFTVVDDNDNDDNDNDIHISKS